MALTSTFYYYQDTLLTAQIAKVLEREAESNRYAERARGIKDAFNKEFNDAGKYAVNPMSPIDTHGSQTSQLLPLALDMVPEPDWENCVEVLLREVAERFDFHPDTGIVGTRYLLDVLSAIGHPDTAYRILTQTSYPSIGYMIDQGATTLWERWENLSGVGMNSHNHIMFGSVDTWFYQTLCGITPVEPAWESVRIAPWLPPEMSHAGATIWTVHGTLASSWTVTGDAVQLSVEIPVGCTAVVEVPCGSSAELTEGGQKLTGVPKEMMPEGIGSVAEIDGVVAVKVGSGDYRFEWSK
jgi:alpha-L-rhamnosidase